MVLVIAKWLISKQGSFSQYFNALAIRL